MDSAAGGSEACCVVPRYYLQAGGEIKSVDHELHGFGNASKTAFDAVVLIRIATDGDCYASLVCSKSRVAPLENQSIPRLELLAGLALARLVSTVKIALQPITRVDNVYCWLDSLMAIYWILQEKKEWKALCPEPGDRDTMPYSARELVPLPYRRECCRNCPKRYYTQSAN